MTKPNYTHTQFARLLAEAEAILEKIELSIAEHGNARSNLVLRRHLAEWEKRKGEICSR
jgi:hypothetical protein